MGSCVGCVVDASDVSSEVAKDLAARLGASSLFIRGAVSLPRLKAKAPVASPDGLTPGARLADDDSSLRSALHAARDAALDTYIVLPNPLAGRPDWQDLFAEDSGGRSADRVDPNTPPLCPNHPKLIRWVSDVAVEVARVYKPTGLLFENLALGSPHKIDTLFTCWCDLCRARTDELGYDADRIRIALQGARSKLNEAAAALHTLRDFGIAQFLEAVGYDVGFLDWLNFRADSVSALLYEARKALAALDASLRVAVLTKAPTVAMLAGQRRMDVLRDTTLADFYAPVICGHDAGVLSTLAAHAQLVTTALRAPDHTTALRIAAKLHGYDDLPLPAAAAELDRSPSSRALIAVAERELALTLAPAAGLARWPAIDLAQLPDDVRNHIVDSLTDSEAEGFIYLGVPQ